jgi:3-isopropylmalate dehydrogenase
VTVQAVKVLRAVTGQDALELTEAPIGAAGIDAAGEPLPEATLGLARKATRFSSARPGVRARKPCRSTSGPEAVSCGCVRRWRSLRIFARRSCFPELVGASTLKPEVVEGLDIVILRELNGDAYYGEPRGIIVNARGEREGVNTIRYSEPEIERIAHVAFRTAQARSRKVCSVDKANVLEASQLWREVVTKVGAEYPDVALTHAYVDAAAMMLIRAPKQFDVVVAGNIFGDILSDAAAMLTGSIGMLPSASLGTGRLGLYEPVHGTAPDIAGRNIANPLAAILSVAMMLRHSFGQPERADRIHRAVGAVLRDGYRTADIFQPGMRRVGTEEMGTAIVAALRW